MEANPNTLLPLIRQAAQSAGEEILSIYESADFGVEAKADDSPLTRADRAAHNTIVKHLQEQIYPILSEEGKEIPYATRKQWEYFWLVDPLDGTKEFIKKNGEFTVNIALIHQGLPVMGVVYAPVLNKMYYAAKGEGSFCVEEGQEQKIHSTQQTPEVVRVVASRSHLNDETKDFIARYPHTETVSMGSSLKFLLVAEGKADVYPRLAPTMEWDTAAAQIIVEEAGGKVINWESKSPLSYNKENLLNPHFVVYSQASLVDV